MMKKKTKIVATMGPATSKKEVLKKMLLAGLDVCRINFSHGAHEDHLKTVKLIRELDKELQKNTAILGDLQGPKLRIGEVENGSFKVKAGDEILIGVNDQIGTSESLSITHADFPNDVKEGEIILIDDGKLRLKILTTDTKKWVKARFLNDGVVSSRKGVNLPDTKVSIPSLTKKETCGSCFA